MEIQLLHILQEIKKLKNLYLLQEDSILRKLQVPLLLTVSFKNFKNQLLPSVYLSIYFLKQRKKYFIVILPMVNPDGVIHGNNRTNLMGLDVNRKWESFPEKKFSY